MLPLILILTAACILLPAGVASAQSAEAHWIWSPAQEKRSAPQGDCYFRKTFPLEDPEHGQIQITCDDAYELYVNGRHLGSDDDWRTLEVYDITRYLVRGNNTIAVKATNNEQGTAGLAARVVVKQRGGTHVSHSTNTQWKTSLKGFTRWTKPSFSDPDWLAAQSFGALGATLPWGNEVRLAGEYGRFRTKPEFEVEWVIAPDETGSLIAMTFNELGQIIASQENGPLLLITDKDKDGVHESVETYCGKVKNCQGLLALNGFLLATGDGPNGAGLYRLSDQDRDAKIDQVDMLLPFKGPMREHGPHAVRLGPDGLIYVLAGNHTALDVPVSDDSPHRHYYEGDLVTPRYEDPGGHAVGIKAPGSTVLRTDTSGSFVELFAGGLRNPYDIAFNRQGDLFTYDADMEWDAGTPWYRPTRINHVTPGAEFGWRSGWSKWPDYYLDSLPAALDTGPGSPTGVVFYDHVMYPVRYQNALFGCDWSRGRIIAAPLEKSGGSYHGPFDVFVEGRPLNVTDIEVGPDGWLYFSTGGRDTAGGIYRVVWTGNVPPAVTRTGSGIEQAIRQPQLNSSWARHRITKVQRALGTKWEPQLEAIARDTKRPVPMRTRAFDLLQLFGPAPKPALLVDVSSSDEPQIRAKTAYLMGLMSDQICRKRLVDLLDDDDATVRRTAIEALVRSAADVPATKLIDLLSDPDRFVAYAARRALETRPLGAWKHAVLVAPEIRVFLQGSTALMVAHADKKTAQTIVNRCLRMLRGEVLSPRAPSGFISDPDFVDLLRVVQLAIIRGNLSPDDIPTLGQQLAHEYPSRDPLINRELVRLLVHLQETSAAPRMVQQLTSNIPDAEKLHVAMYASRLKHTWDAKEKTELIKYFEHARTIEGGLSLGRYVDRAMRDFSQQLDDSERRRVLAGGAQWPAAALAVLATLPPNPGKATLRQIRLLDQQLVDVEGESAERLRVGIVAVMGRSQDPQAMDYLRGLYQSDPQRRAAVAMGLAQDPSDENWPLLIQSLPVLDGVAAREVLSQLARLNQKPKGPEPIRQAILCGLRSGEPAGQAAVNLLEEWTGENVSQPDDAWNVALAKWQKWFAETYPESPDPQLPVDSSRSKWTYDELVTFLESPEGSSGDPQKGGVGFERAQCVKCHRYGDRGEVIGPDLTTVSQRFQKKEILQAILFPSHVISDQYASKKIVTTDGRTFAGMVAPAGQNSIFVLPSSGERVEILTDEIDEIAPSKQSAMPEGLLDSLTLQEIADLFAYLSRPPRSSITSRRGPPSR